MWFFHNRRLFGLSLCALALLGRPDPAEAADPFYDRLRREGTQAYVRGDHQLAAESLRLACFGLLNEPRVLAETLVVLALAQAEIGDQPAFFATFDRIVEVERRFQAFSQLALEPDVRQALESHLESWAAPDVLEQIPAFRDVARRKRVAQIAALPADERRLELDRRLVSEPERTTWSLMLADLDFDQGRYQAAIDSAETVLRLDPDQRQARCVRGKAGAAMGACADALEDLESCDDPPEPAELIEIRLGCLIRQQDWESAERLLSELPGEIRQRSVFRRIAREIRRGKSASAAAEQEAIIAESSPPQEDSPTTGEDVEAPLITEEDDAGRDDSPNASQMASPQLLEEMEQARSWLRIGSREKIEQAFSLARQLADRYPRLSEPQHLTAEIAYRLSRWQDALTYFERGGEPGTSQPDRLFYLAVARFETGDRAGARETLELCLPVLEQTENVRSYVTKILNTEN